MKKINVAVAVIQNSEGKVLLTQRYSPESPWVHLKWQLPGGEVEKDETAEQACVREIREETGYKIKILTKSPIILIHEYNSIEYVLHAFKAKVISGTIDTKLDIETADAKWCEIEEISLLPTLEDTKELVEQCLE